MAVIEHKTNFVCAILVEGARLAHNKLIDRETARQKQLRWECCKDLALPVSWGLVAIFGLMLVISSHFRSIPLLLTIAVLISLSAIFAASVIITAKVVLPVRQLIRESKMKVNKSTQTYNCLLDVQKVVKEKYGGPTH